MVPRRHVSTKEFEIVMKRLNFLAPWKWYLSFWIYDFRTPDEWVLESEVQRTKHIEVREAVTESIDSVNLVLYPAVNGGTPPQTRTKQRRKPVKNSWWCGQNMTLRSNNERTSKSELVTEWQLLEWIVERVWYQDHQKGNLRRMWNRMNGKEEFTMKN